MTLLMIHKISQPEENNFYDSIISADCLKYAIRIFTL